VNYTVYWRPSAEAELADLWLNTALRAEVTAASHRIDRVLAVNAHNRGESRTGNDRVFFDAPLGVLFSVDLVNREVQVWHVWIFQTGV
jgi:hypothetical protein